MTPSWSLQAERLRGRAGKVQLSYLRRLLCATAPTAGLAQGTLSPLQVLAKISAAPSWTAKLGQGAAPVVLAPSLRMK